MGFAFQGLLGFHKLYSSTLLHAAKVEVGLPFPHTMTVNNKEMPSMSKLPVFSARARAVAATP